MFKKLWPFPATLGFALALFFAPIFLTGKGFYYGDYREQFYPWAFYLHQALRRFTLPLWAPEIGCGFPLLAEGQIGALHPLQAALFYFLPFPTAYHAGFVLYFALAGIGIYLVARQIGISVRGTTIAALVFLFSSPYAGMAYGLASLRTLCLFPWCLYAVGRLTRSSGNRKDLALLGICLGIFLLGGYWSWAPYLLAGTGGYFIYCLSETEEVSKKCPGLCFALAWLLGLGLAAAQFFPTLELVRASVRSEAPLEFALQKSLNPLSPFTFFWPSFGAFVGSDLYTGALPFCLASIALCRWRADRRVRILGWTVLFIYLMALGKHNPLYVFAVKLIHFYALRGPSKIMIFASFALALLAGIGWDAWMETGTKSPPRFPRAVLMVFFVALAAWGLTALAARLFSEPIAAWADHYVRSHIVGKFGHPYTLETYLDRIPDGLKALADKTSLKDRFIRTGVFLWSACAIFFVTATRLPGKRRAVFLGALILILADLWFYTAVGSGFKGNAVKPIEKDGVVTRIVEAKGFFRVFEFRTPPLAPARWAPNVNLLFGYSTAGIYSPLAIEAYREALRSLGGVDNAMGVLPSTVDEWVKDKPLLDLLNVRFVLATEGDPLRAVPGLRRVPIPDESGTLYENVSYRSRAQVGDPNRLDEARSAEVTEYAPRRVVLRAEAKEGESLILSDVWYPGWKAFVDDRPVPILKLHGVFREVRLSSGGHVVRFVYEPFYFYAGLAVSALSLMGCLACFLPKR